jgi:hypothetical protein
MVPTEHRSFVDPGACDPKSLTIEVTSALSPRFGEGQRIRIDALCRSPLSPRSCANVSQRKESIVSVVSLNQLRTRSSVAEESSENASRHKSNAAPCPSGAAAPNPSGVRYFSVHLVIAAVADGSILSDHGTRKTKCVLDQLTRNVSKEQNQVRQHVRISVR